MSSQQATSTTISTSMQTSVTLFNLSPSQDLSTKADLIFLNESIVKNSRSKNLKNNFVCDNLTTIRQIKSTGH